MRQRIILLFANAYQMTDDTGKRLEGVTCNYYFNTDLSAVDNVNGSVGTRPAKGNMPYETFLKVRKAPALYDAEFELSVDKDGKPILKIIDVEFIEEVRIVPCSEAASFDAAGASGTSGSSGSADAAPAASTAKKAG